MGLLNTLERRIDALVRRVTEQALGRPTEANAIEIRSAVLDEVERAVEPVGRGETIFPFNRLVLAIASPDTRKRAMLEAALRDRRFLDEIRGRIRRSRAEPPRDLTLEVTSVENAGEDWADPRYDLLMIVAPEAETRESAPAAQLHVTQGRASKGSYPITPGRFNIGRRSDVIDEDERLVRRNDVAFDEGGDSEVNLTVSRLHAHVWYEAEERSWRIADDGSHYGTRVFRDGHGLEVPPRDPRGIRLRPGDEIYCGQACLRFELMPEDARQGEPPSEH